MPESSSMLATVKRLAEVASVQQSSMDDGNVCEQFLCSTAARFVLCFAHEVAESAVLEWDEL
eukprot:6381581-Prorocentrum_lima.AAC.1